MAELDLGNLVVKLSADIDQLKSDFSAAQKETKRTADEASKLTAAFNKAFNGTATAATRMAGNFNQLSESVVKIFGDKGLSSAKSFGKEIGLGTEQVETMSLALKGLGGAFSAVAVAAGGITTHVGAALVMVLGLVAAYGALKNAMPKEMQTLKHSVKFTAAQLTGDEAALEQSMRERVPGWDLLSDEMNSSGLGRTEEPGSSSGLDIIGSFKESMEAGLADFEGITSKIKEMFAPDQTKKDLEEKKKLAEAGNKAERERQAALQEAFAEQAKIYDEERKALEEKIAIQERLSKQYEEAVGKMVDAQLEAAEQLRRSIPAQRDANTQTTNRSFASVSVASRGGPTMTEAELDAATEKDKRGLGIKDSAKDFGNAALQGSGVGDMVAAFQKGGGIIGGIINVVLKLFEKSEGFKTILGMVNDVVQMLADGLGQVFDGLQPIVGVIGWLVQFIVGVLQPILSKVGKVLEPLSAVLAMSMVALEGLGPMLNFFAQAIGGVLQAIGWILKEVIFPITQAVNFAVMKVAQAVSWVINGIIDVVSAIIWEVGAILQKMGAQDAGSALKSAANAMHQYEIDTKAINDAANDMWDMSYDDALKMANDTIIPLDDLGDSAGDAAESMREFSESITNVPSGYKVALARFNATTPVNANTVLGGASNTTNNLSVVIQSDDPQSIWQQLKKLMERDNIVQSGSPIGGAPEFLAA